MKTRHHPIRSAQGTRQLRPDALREDSRRDGEEGGSMRSGSLGKVWLLFSLRAASQNEAGSARSCSSGCSSEYWRSSNDNRNTQPPALATPRRGHSLAKIARSSQSDSVGCHLQNIVNPLMEKPLMSYWRIPLAGNVTWGSDEVKTKVLRACANFALSEAESYFSDRFGVMTRFLERNETIPVDKPNRNPDGESPRFKSPIWIENPST